MIKVKYRCLHPSCQVFCKKGELLLEESVFSELSAALEAGDTFKSPRDVCRLGFSQPFSVVSIEGEGTAAETGGAEAGVEDSKSEDPLEVLMAEHGEVLKKLDRIEEQVRKRDVDGLWITTAAVENDIMLHSMTKEEKVLFPAVRDLIPMGPSLLAIMHEDHEEFIALLHSVRGALQDGDIQDGILGSIVANLKNHISKENNELFGMINEHIDPAKKRSLLRDMERLEEAHVPVEPGDRLNSPSLYSEARKRMDAEIMALKQNISGQEGSSCDHH